MDLDLAIVLGVLVVVAIVHPDTEATLHRVSLALRLWRGGYGLRRAWRLSDRPS